MSDASRITVPAELAEYHESYDDEEGRAWIAGLPELAAGFLDRWELRLDGPPAHGAVALVLPVRRADDTPAVLKLQPVDEETEGEPAALRAWAAVVRSGSSATTAPPARCCWSGWTPGARWPRWRTATPRC